MRFLLAGDSTVASASPQEYPVSGWGAPLERLLRPQDEVLNFARGGATTESFIVEGLWSALLTKARPRSIAERLPGRFGAPIPAVGRSDARRGGTRNAPGI
jgi:hypothetical protein